MPTHLTEREKIIYDLLLENKEKGITLKYISEILGITPHTIEKYFTGLRRKGIKIKRFKKSQKDDFIFWVEKPDFEDKPTYKKEYETQGDYGKDLLIGVKKVAEVQTNRWLTDIKPIRFKDETIGMVFLADWHLGHPHTDYGVAEDICKTIDKTEGLYVVTIGDMIDNSVNAFAPRGATNIVDKDGQLAMLEYLLGTITSRLLVMFEGNHEIRSQISDHFRITEFLSKEFCARYGQYGARFSIFMNDREIKFYCRHKMKGHSQYNPLHPNVRAPLFGSAGDADIIVRAHTHERGTGILKVGDKFRYMIVCGNLQLYDEYLDRSDYETRRYSFPILIIRKNGEMRLCPTFKQGVEDLKIFRECDDKHAISR